MLIRFLHNDQCCSAYLVCEPAKIRNIIVVYILDSNAELGYEVIFSKTGENHWSTSARIKTDFPLTYQNLCKQLTEIFTDNIFTAHQPGKEQLNAAEDRNVFIEKDKRA